MSDASDPDEEWQFGLDDVGPEAEPPGPEPLEPGSPSLENAVFVLIGVAGAILLLLTVL